MVLLKSGRSLLLLQYVQNRTIPQIIKPLKRKKSMSFSIVQKEAKETKAETRPQVDSNPCSTGRCEHSGWPVLFRTSIDYLPHPGDRLSKIHDNVQQQLQQRQYVEALAAAAAVAAVSERVVRVYRTTHAVPLVAHARKLHTCASTHTQCKRKSQHSHTAEATIAQRLLASAAADRTTIIAAARSSGGGVAAGWPATTEPPIVRFMTPCLGGCALTYASARGVHIHTK